MKKSKKDLTRGWLEKAKRDFLTAQRELNDEEPFTDIITYHAQQAAEKFLKGYLTWKEIEFPRTHDIEDLVSLAMNEEPDFEEIKTESSVLSPYAVEVRYPEFEEPLLEDAREAVEIASDIRDFVICKLPEDL
jgi:HEPN domain-containing protein